MIQLVLRPIKYQRGSHQIANIFATSSMYVGIRTGIPYAYGVYVHLYTSMYNAYAS